MMRTIWISWLVIVAVVAVLGCGGPAEKEQEPSASPKKSANQVGEKPAEAPAAPLERPLPAWAKNPPPRGQKPIYDLPLDIQLDTPSVPAEIASPAPPIPKQ